MEGETYITKVIDGEGFCSFTPFAGTYLLEKQGITTGRIILDDGRRISAAQRKHIYATLRDISAYEWGYDAPELMKEWLKYDFIAQSGEVNDYFSLSNCSITTARLFLQYLIDLCLEWDIPTNGSLLERDPDTARYLYSCIIHKRCFICGKSPSELHHAEDRVGMGRKRKEIIHLGMRVMSLCASHHIECHTAGQISFNDKHKIFGIAADADICKAKGLKH